MDEPDIPMLDVGDFEVLDECVGEDEEDYDHEEEDHDHNPKRKRESMRRKEHEEHMDDNSGDNADNVLDVSIDVTENDFLESVEKDFSENIEDDVVGKPRNTRLLRGRTQPTVQLKKLNVNSNNSNEEPVVPRKKPGPKSKTMNVQTPAKQTPAKKPIQKIQFSDKKEEKPNEEPKSNAGTQKIPVKKAEPASQKPPIKKPEAPKPKEQNKNVVTPKPKVQTKTPAFLKKDLTDEEIMEHFDEIENTVLTSDTFVIENEIEEMNAEEPKDNENNDANDENKDTNDTEKKDEEKDEEENWDDCDTNTKKKPEIKVEKEEFKESEMWYADKLQKKQNIVEDKLTNLAKAIQYSYPLYKKWLDRNESLFGTAICKVESPKHSPLDQLRPNRWKFVCNKKQSQQSTKDGEKQATQNNWQVVPGVADAKLEDKEEYPPFVMKVVKVFEDFLQSLETSKDDGAEDEKTEDESKKNEEDSDKDKPAEKEKAPVPIPDGLTLLLRCNRKEEVMMNITGKNIKTEFTDKIKDFYENGPGKECNVKSLYCKTIIKENNVIRTKSTFLLGSETLEDSIGSLKIHLPPKTNIWTNLSGVEVLANVVAEYLVPTKKTTIIEVGCGTGLITLLLAPKCQKIIGVDVPKEISEAESLCKSNGIDNAEFTTGKPKLVMQQIDDSLKNSKAVAIINTNSVFGRSLEVISALRKMSTLGRIVIITTLTKQSIRSILELTQPADDIYGNPFIPIKTRIVDTTPKSFGFEIVMSMERRTMRNLLKVSAGDGVNNTAPVGLISKSKAAALKKNVEIEKLTPQQKKFQAKFLNHYKAPFVPGKKYVPNPTFKVVNKFGIKRPFPGSDTFVPGAKKFKSFEKPWLGPNIRMNPLHDKKLRDSEGDLRDRLSSNRVEPTVIASEVLEQKKILDAAKEKLTGAGSSVDVDTVKKLQEMLNLAIEKTNKLQSQLPPRSVWDRIAPAESGKDSEEIKSNAPPMRGRLVKETGPKEIIITTSNNREYQKPGPISGKSRKYDNIPPAEPNQIMPVSHKPDRLKMTQSVSQKPNSAPYQKPGPNRFQGGNYRKPDNQASEPWNRGKPQSGPRGNESHNKWDKRSPPRRPLSPPRRTPPQVRRSSPPSRRPMSPPRRPLSPARRPMSPPRRPMSPVRRPLSPPRRPLSPPRRPVSPNLRVHSSSSSSRNLANSGRQGSPPGRRHNSPPRRSSPPRRYADEWDIPNRNSVQSRAGPPEKSSWHGPPNPSSSSNWNQGSNNSNKYRSENESKWDSRWKEPAMNSGAGSNWDVKKDANRDMGRHMEPRTEPRFEPRHEPRHEPRVEPRHEFRHEPRMEPRHEPRIEPRHEPRHEKKWDNPARNEKDDYGDLPEDARDPWGDDPPQQKETLWNVRSQQSAASGWSREKSNETWSNKSNYPQNSGGGMGPGMQNPNMNMNMNVGMNNPNKPMWQPPAPPQQQNRNSNWLPPGNWQTSTGVAAGHMVGNSVNNWQPAQPNYSNYQSRPYNNNPYMNRR